MSELADLLMKHRACEEARWEQMSEEKRGPRRDLIQEALKNDQKDFDSLPQGQEPTKDDIEKAQSWLKANCSADIYRSLVLFEKSTIRLCHDLARFRALAREEGHIAGEKSMRERAAKDVEEDQGGSSSRYMVDAIRALKIEGRR